MRINIFVVNFQFPQLQKERGMKKKYIFEVQFEYTVEANSYSEAVRLADKQLPDEDGKTTFVVNTMDYGFVPNQETIKNMHEWGDKCCHCRF